MDTVAIIGSHPRTRFDFDRTDCEIWMFNEAISNKNPAKELKDAQNEKDENKKAHLLMWMKRHANAVFQMHAEPIWRNPANRNDNGHVKWLQSQTEIPVYMQDAYPDVPMARKYPLDDVLGMIRNDKAHLLSSSVALAIAYACLLGTYKRIEVWGVAMETNTEYQWQREGVAFWKGFAMGRGIEFLYADPTFESPLYGYEGKVSVDYEEFEKRVAELKPEAENLVKEYSAALLDTKKALFFLVDDGSEQVQKTLFTCVDKQRELGEKLGFLDGAIQENERYKLKADAMREASGDFIFSRQEFESGLASLRKRAGEVNTKFISTGTRLDDVHNYVLRAAKGSPKRKRAIEDYSRLLQEYMNLNNQIAIYNGAANENGRYMAYLDKHIRAAGGAKSEEVLLERLQNEKG